jgi:hypothetical protein
MRRQIPACPLCSKPLHLAINLWAIGTNQPERIWRHVGYSFRSGACPGTLSIEEWPLDLSDEEEKMQRNFKSRTRYAKAKWGEIV